LMASLVGMARGIPRPSILEVPDLFSLLDSPRNRFYHSSDPRVLAKIPRGPRKSNIRLFTMAEFACYHLFPISEFSYKLIRFLLNKSTVKSDNEIGNIDLVH
jgi:hypothetical protein